MKRFLLLLATTVKFITPGMEDNKPLETISALFAENNEQQAADPYAFENLRDTALRQLYMEKYTEILIAHRSFTSPFLIAAICEFASQAKTDQQRTIIKKAIDEASDSDKDTNRFANKLNIEAHMLRGKRNTPTVQLNFDERKNIEHQAARKMMLYIHQARKFAQETWYKSGTEFDPELIG